MTDTNTSTRSVADVEQHRRARVATYLRKLADRIEHDPDVAMSAVHFDRAESEAVDVLHAPDEVHRHQRGQIDDETHIIEVQLVPYCECNGRREDGSWILRGDEHDCPAANTDEEQQTDG